MILEASNVHLSFGGIRALQGAGVEVEEGSITALIGPNGAGKTTLFNAVGGFASIDSGEIRLKGRSIVGAKPWQIARMGLSRTFQTPSGFPSMTVWENLMVAGLKREHESPFCVLRPRQMLDAAEQEASRRAGGLLDRLGLSGLIDSHLASLSAADLRFVEIARQLMVEPDVLLLDEPAAGFGPDKLRQLGQLIRQLRDEGLTILMIEHNLAFVMGLADTVHVLANGKVIAKGPPAAVATDEAVVRNYIGSGHGDA